MPSPNKHSARWQGALLTQLNVLNYAHSLPEHMLKFQRLPGALNPFLNKALYVQTIPPSSAECCKGHS